MKLPTSSLFATIGLFLTAVPALQADDVQIARDVVISKAVPSDVFIFVAGRHNPEQEFLEKAWGEVFEELQKSGVIGDIFTLMTGSMSAEDAAEFEKTTDRIKELADGVEWDKLASREFVFAGRMGVPMPEFMFIGRGPQEAVEKNHKGLRAILSEIEDQSEGAVTVADREEQGAKVSTLRPGNAPFSINIASRKDVMVIAMGDGLLKDALGLLEGKSEAKSLVSTSRFSGAFRKLPAAEDEWVFFDVANLLKGVRGIFEAMRPPQGEAKGEGEEDPSKIFVALLDDLSILDYVAATSRTEGMRVFTDAISQMTPDAKSKGLYKVVVPKERIEKFDRFIPKEAVTFSVSRGVNWNALYAWIKDFMRTKVPHGEEHLVQWSELQTQIGFDLQKDVLDWLSGPIVTIETAPSSPMGGPELVVLLEVSDEKLAADRVKTGLDRLGQLLGAAMGGMGGEVPGIVSSPVEVAGRKGFYEVKFQIPALMMIGAQFSPIWGVADGHLIVGTGKKAVGRCLDTAAGKHDSIVKSARFDKEALVPKSSETNLVSISFTDETRTAEELQGMLAGFGMMGMFTAFLPPQEDGVIKILGALPGLAVKLQPVAKKMNFFQSSSAYETFDGTAWRAYQVSNYRVPPKEKEEDKDFDDWGEDEKPKKEKPKNKTGVTEPL